MSGEHGPEGFRLLLVWTKLRQLLTRPAATVIDEDRGKRTLTCWSPHVSVERRIVTSNDDYVRRAILGERRGGR